MTRNTKRLRNAALALTLGASSTVYAGGFAITSQSASAVGNAFAGGAASAEDPSTIWFNPAGMLHLGDGWNVAVGVSAVNTSFDFQNTGSTGVFAAPGSGDGGDGGAWGAVPSAYLSKKVNPDIALGFAINAPFGLKTDWDPGWRGRFLAIRSKVIAVNLNPSIAYKVNDQLFIGGGLDMQYFKTELTQFAGAAGIARVKADDWGYGWNLGALWNVPNTNARIGMHYRSKISYHLNGNATFTSTNGAGDGLVSAGVTTPESLAVNGFTSMGRWDFMAGATWTRWNRLERITIVRDTRTNLGAPPGSVISTLEFDWRNTTLVSAGVSYRVNETFKLRGGVGYDSRASNDITRTPRLPDEARVLLTAGVNIAATKKWKIDFAYLHDFVKDAQINQAAPAPAPGRLIGVSKNSADVFSVMVSGTF